MAQTYRRYWNVCVPVCLQLLAPHSPLPLATVNAINLHLQASVCFLLPLYCRISEDQFELETDDIFISVWLIAFKRNLFAWCLRSDVMLRDYWIHLSQAFLFGVNSLYSLNLCKTHNSICCWAPCERGDRKSTQGLLKDIIQQTRWEKAVYLKNVKLILSD